MWFRRRKPAPEPASPHNVTETLNLTDALRVFLVDRVKAELELEQLKLESRRKELDWRHDRREKQREAGRNRSRSARRSSTGRFQANAGVDCFICSNPGRSFNIAQLEFHRSHGVQLVQQSQPHQKLDS